MTQVEPAQAEARVSSGPAGRLPGRYRVLIALLAAAVGFLFLIGLSHALRSARLRAVSSLDPGGVPAVSDPAFAVVAAAVTETALLPGNTVQVLADGDGTFPPLLADLGGARRSITMQMYYGKPGMVTDSVLHALADRARDGVRVYFMYDAIGTDRLIERHRRHLVEAGVRVTAFRPIRWRDLDLLGHRAHSRVVVIDGRIGYTGGFGLDDKWLGRGRRAGEWREANVRFTGPAIAQLQAAFLEEWAEATGELLVARALFPPAEATAGPHLAGLLHSLPGAAPSPAERLLALSIAAARRTLYIANAYFIPNRSFRDLLAAAARRGVDVRVLTNGSETDNTPTLLAARSHYEELLSAGIRVFEYRPSMMHAKTLVADGVWSTIGSVNFDNRSLALNSETTLVVLDEAIGATMDSLFLEDLRVSDEVTLDRFRRRAWVRRVLERAAGLLARAL